MPFNMLHQLKSVSRYPAVWWAVAAIMFSIFLVEMAFFIAVGVASVAIKVSQVAFVASASPNQWTASQFLSFFGFVNSVISVYDVRCFALV